VIQKFFIHIPKNGGMTIRQSNIARPKVTLATPDTHKNQNYTISVRNKMQQLGEHDGFEHARWKDINKELQDKMIFFAIVRNPWDRVVSRYFFAKKVIYHEEGSNQFGKTDYADTSSFEAFLDERHKWGESEYMWHRAVRGWYPAKDYVTCDKGIMRCDILRLEHLDEEICKYLNLPFMTGPRNVTAINNKSYQDIYTPETIQVVADWYKKDIDQWDFDFDTPARKNYWDF
tara:strand:+ start:1055 stop:1747 length:693 start_codon:yes stop_codon:yes gene_type:complete